MKLRRWLGAWSPWSPADGLRWFVVSLAGLLTTTIGWFVTDRQDRLDDQIGWMTVAVAGFAVVGYANITWLLQGRFTIIQRRERLLPTEPSEVTAGAPAPARAGTSSLVAGPRLGRYHLAECPLAAGKGWPTVDVAGIDASDRRPCGVCRP